MSRLQSCPARATACGSCPARPPPPTAGRRANGPVRGRGGVVSHTPAGAETEWAPEMDGPPPPLGAAVAEESAVYPAATAATAAHQPALEHAKRDVMGKF